MKKLIAFDSLFFLLLSSVNYTNETFRTSFPDTSLLHNERINKTAREKQQCLDMIQERKKYL